MSEKKNTKFIPINILNNSNLERSNIRRSVRIDYPIYSIPVHIMERTSEPYEEIERNIEELLLLTEIISKHKLFEVMGLSKLRLVGENVLQYLMSIGHIEEDKNNGKLSLTDLGKDSLKINNKIKIEKSARMLYFDAFSLNPLPEKYYSKSEAEFFYPLDYKDFGVANVIDIWNDLNPDSVKGILNMSGEERLKYNIPQEMVDINIDENIFVFKKEDIISKGIIVFFTLYVAVLENINSFCSKINSTYAIGQLNFKIFNGVSQKPDDYFERLVKLNFDKLLYIFRPLIENFDPLSSDETRIWGKELNAYNEDYRLNFKLEMDGNLKLSISSDDIERWVKLSFKPPIKDIAFNNIIPIKDRNHHGRIIRISAPSACIDKAVSFLLQEKELTLRDQDKSEEYINAEKEKLILKIKKAWENN